VVDRKRALEGGYTRAAQPLLAKFAGLYTLDRAIEAAARRYGDLEFHLIET
jgi:hypothetical protein